MINLNVNLGDRAYPIYIATDYKGIKRSLSRAKINSKIAVITDENVDKWQFNDFKDALVENGYEAIKYVIKPGEKFKNLDTVKDIYSFLLGAKFDRLSTLIALGGGVVGDITGFAAATYLRGINLIQVPTTLLAQADSSVGGKVGVDFEGSKNIIGAFYQPKAVYINVNSLKTLEEKQLKAGLAEVIKHGLIYDDEFFEYIDYNIDKIMEINEDVLQYMTKINCSIKGKIVEEDEKESGLRAILNFGHTIGHSIESVMNFELLHGECVSLGMIAACRMAEYLEMIDEKLTDKVESLIVKIGLPTKLPELNVEKVYKQMFYDKKIKNNKLLFILPKKIGEVIQISLEDDDVIKRAITSLK